MPSLNINGRNMSVDAANDTPLLFDNAGRPKPAAAAWEAALRR